MDPELLFKIGDVIPKTGQYLCVPCGFVQFFTEGALFTTCEACFAGTSNGPDSFTDAEDEFWQFVD